MTDLSDKELIEKALQGDSHAFENLFVRYRDEIMGIYLYKTGNNEADANDMLQDTFVKVFLNLHKFNPGYTFGQWVHTIARNTFIDHARKKKDNIFSIDKVEGDFMPIHPVSTSPTPEQEMMISQSNSIFDSMIESLPQKYRKMIILRFFREYSYEEIAEELSMPIGTVKTRIYRARERLLELICKNDI